MVGSVSAQQNVVYTNGENNTAPITITAATNPTTLTIFAGSATQSGVISDAGTTGNLIFNGGISSTLTLSGVNTYTGTTTVSGGTLAIGADNNLGAAQGQIILSTQSVAGAELLTGSAGDFTTSRAVSINNGVLSAVNGTTAVYNGSISSFDLTFGDTKNGGAVIVNGIISGGSSVAQMDIVNGVVTFTAANTYGGDTAVSNATLQISADSSLGATSTNGFASEVRLFNGELLTTGATFTTNRVFEFGPSSTLAAANGTTATYGGSFSSNSGGTIVIGDGTNHGAIIFSSTAHISGTPAYPGGTDGSAAVSVTSNASLTNNGSITGDPGATGNVTFAGQNPSNGGAGGTGVALAMQAALSNSNTGTITGGTGGDGGPLYAFGGQTFSSAGNGGHGGSGDTLAQNVSFTNLGVIAGGNGGRGGGTQGGGFPGSGGDGGAGIAVAAGSSLTNQGTISGGTGGFGGAGGSSVGDGGVGGAAVTLAPGATFTNQNTITGGSGASYTFGTTIYYNAGGAGVTASGNDTIINAGSITGGLGSGPSTAILLNGGGNSLVLYSISQTSGSVVSASGTTNGGDTLKLGGDTDGTFDTSQIGALYQSPYQYQGFANYAKTGASTWTLTNTTAAVTPWTISQAVLSISSDGALGDASGRLTLDGGTLQTTAGFTMSRAVALTANGGTVDLAGNSLTIAGPISGPGSFALKDATGAGQFTLSGNNTYTGATTINRGRMVVNGSIASLAPVTVNNGGTLGGTGTIAGAVTIHSGGTLTHGSSPGTFTLGALTLDAGSSVDYQLGAPGVTGASDLTVVSGNLTLGGSLSISAGLGFGPGTYDLFNYSGTLSGMLSLGTLPAGYTASNFKILMTAPGEVDLIVTTGLYWNGSLNTANGSVNGGSGSWDTNSTNWTDYSGSTSSPWTPGRANFSTGSGPVSVNANVTADELYFGTGSGAYSINVTAGQALTLRGAGVTNNSGITQNLVTAPGGTISFINSATAGNATITNQGATASGAGGSTNFHDTATAGSATIVNSGATVFVSTGGSANFYNHSTAGNATINNQGSAAGGSGYTVFYDQSTAGSASINNQAGTFSGGYTKFQNSSTAGNAMITNQGNSHLGATVALTFQDTATAGSSTILNQTGGGGSGAVTQFLNSSKAGSATITNQGATAAHDEGASTAFQDTSSAGSATIMNQGGAVTGFVTGGFTNFLNGATAGSATITNQAAAVAGADPGEVGFFNTSSAGSATITNNGASVSGAKGGSTSFLDSSSAGSATIIASGGANGGLGGTTYFEFNAGGGTARAITNGNGAFDISGLYSGMNIGSIEGSGTYYLGGKTLTAGGNNLSTTVSGVIVDGGFNTGTGGSLVKIGTGTLTLSGANAYTGTTTINGGAIIVDGSLASKAAVTVNQGGALGGTGSIAGAVIINSGGTLTSDSSPGTLTLGGLTLKTGSSLDYQLGLPGIASASDLTIVNGNLALGGKLNITAGSGFAAGTYDLFNYSGKLSGSLSLGALPAGYAASNFKILTTVAGQVDLVVTDGFKGQYWNGLVYAPNGTVNGGQGTWDNTGGNWTNSAGTTSTKWAKSAAIFSTGGGNTILSATAVDINDKVTAGAIDFAGGSGFYNFAVLPAKILTINGGGITNHSGVVQSFVTVVDLAGGAATIHFTNSASAGSLTQITNSGAMVQGGSGGMTSFEGASTAGSANIINQAPTYRGITGGTTVFHNTATAGTATILNQAGITGGFGTTSFEDTSTAGRASIANQGALVPGGYTANTQFHNRSKAGSAAISNQGAAVSAAGGGYTQFNETATAGGATITNQSGTVSGAYGGSTVFAAKSTAGTATIVNQGGSFDGPSFLFSGATGAGFALFGQFDADAPTAGSATIINNGGTVTGAGGGYTVFTSHSNAGNATIITNGGTNGGAGGATYFESNADGGSARAITNGNGIFDIEYQTSTNGMHIGSIEGSGTYYLGANTLIVGGNNLSTTVSGVIANGQYSVVGGGGALTKMGTGTLTLTGRNTYTGPTNVSGGTLQIGNGISGDVASGSLVKISPGATLALNLSNGDSFVNSVANSGHLIATGTGNQYSITGTITGPGNVTKSGSGTVALTGANTFTGGTRISAGTLLANNTTGSATGKGTVTVDNGGTLGGSGQVIGGMILNSGGVVEPGAGAMGAAGTKLGGTSLLWNGGGEISLQLGAASADELILSGALTKGSSGKFTLNLIDAGVGLTPVTETLMTFSSTTFSLANFHLVLPANLSGSLVETRTSLQIQNLVASPVSVRGLAESLPEAASADFTSPNATMATQLADQPMLAVVPTPEPDAVALLTLGVGSLLGWRRRRP